MNKTNFPSKYRFRLIDTIQKIEVCDNVTKKVLAFDDSIVKAMEMIEVVRKSNKKIMFIGNGGSAGIASHQAVDYWKNGGIRALAFNDSSLLTCLSNDYSFEEVFSKSIEKFADKGDLVFSISSSGQSKNILNGTKMAISKGCKIISYSGFKPDNPLRSFGNLSFYVPSSSYGFVEIIHLFIIHSILDLKLYSKDGVDVFNKNKKER